MSATILYQDIAVGAAEAATVTSNGTKDFADISLLPFGDGNVPRESFETGAWGLDGQHYGVPEQGVAYWSSDVSDENGEFAIAPNITITFSEYFSSTGITLLFPPYDYCRNVNVKWYVNNLQKESEDFAVDNSTYVCEKTVEGFNKIVITLQNTFLPYSSAKLYQIYIGTYRQFGLDELRNVQLANETDLITAKLPISQLKWTLDSKKPVDYMFQFKQPVETRLDDNLFCIYYVKEANRISANLYDVVCQDAFGILETIPFSGMKYDNVSALELFTSLVSNRFPLYITALDKEISGVILPSNLREALRQVLFSWGVCAATDNCDGIRVFDPSTAVTVIPPSRTYMGVTVKKETSVTKVNVTAHEYVRSDNGTIEINGVRYNDNKTVYSVVNPLANSSSQENIIDITDATLVSNETAQTTAQKVYNIYSERSDINATVLWEKEKLGDFVIINNEWGGIESGNIEKIEMIFSHTNAAKLTIRKTRSAEENYFSGELYSGEADA